MSDLPPLVDIHNHLIPGVDDGARNVSEALAALWEMREHGVRRLVCTPHINADGLRNQESFAARMREIDDAWEALCASAAAHCPEIQIARGHEIMLDVPRLELAEPRLRIAGGPWVLVEFPPLFIPAGSTQALRQLCEAGWHPVVAHPERYVNINVDSLGALEIIEEWRDLGVRTAVNAGSLVGAFGGGAATTVREMLRRGWVDMIGSDYHARPGRALLLRECYHRLLEWDGADQADMLMSLNPGLVLDGARDTVSVPPLPLGDGMWERIRRIFSR